MRTASLTYPSLESSVILVEGGSMAAVVEYKFPPVGRTSARLSRRSVSEAGSHSPLQRFRVLTYQPALQT